MGKQKGGRIFYKATRLTTPEAVEEVFSSGGKIPIPSQTGGQCSIDSVATTLFYTDVIRKVLWKWVFKQAPGGNIEIPDEDLHLEVLRTNAHKLTRVFMLTVAARVLRILESAESRGFVREKSFSPSDETHGTTPSEVCSNLGNTLIRVLHMIKGSSTGPVALISPESRSSFSEYSSSTASNDRKRLFWWIFTSFLLREVSFQREIGGIFLMQKAPVVTSEEPIAFNAFVFRIEDEENPELVSTDGHILSILRVNGEWYVADNEVGSLLKLGGVDGGPIPPETIPLLDDPSQSYIQLNSIAPGPENTRRSKVQYTVRRVADRSVIAQTPMVYTLEKTPGFREPLPTQIMREDPDETRIVPGMGSMYERLVLYWRPTKSSGRVTPPPDASTSIMGMLGTAAAGSGERVATVAELLGRKGGKRKTRKTKSKRRKTKRGGPRLSSPK